MSLLLEALKRAEKAKEEAQRSAEESAPPGDNRRVMTRDHLPDITQPLEILSDDIGQTARVNEPDPRPAPRTGAPAQPAGARASVAEPARSERATAKRVFEAKLREPNPRLPFYIALAVLGVCAIGVVVYFWYQLRSPPPLAVANPAPPVGERMKALAESAAPVTTPAAPLRQIRGMPTGGKAEVQPPRTEATPAPAPGQRASPTRRRASKPQAATRTSPPIRRAPRTDSTAAAAGSSNVITSRGATTPGIHPQVEAGYAAYQAGDMDRAGDAYRKALADEPNNRDALLGLAAVETRLRNPAGAEALYARVLERDPRDVHARAGLLGLRGAKQDPVFAESQLKNLLASDPQATELQFTLGNQYAQQARWTDAQQAYFRAFTAEPDNPDYAYNLAVSLDQLHKPGLALEYYRKAIALAGARSAGFNRAAAEKRVQELAR